jgi:hypothetical protein
MPFNQMSGLPMDLAVYGSGTGPQPFATAKDYDRFLKRVRSSRAGSMAPSSRCAPAWRAASRCRVQAVAKVGGAVARHRHRRT